VTRPKYKVYIVLPAFNEEPRIGSLLDRIDEAMFEAALDYEIIVVDDGSTDATEDIVRDRAARHPISLIRHPRNLGLGAAIRDGLLDATPRAAGDDVIVTMDADDTHTPWLILRMVRMLREGHDVVIASRYQPGSRSVGVPLLRRALSWGGSLLFRLILPIGGVQDYTCGFRAYRADVLQQAVAHYGKDFIDQDGFQVMVDILLKLRRMHLIFGEVPFILRYDYKQGATKMNVPVTIRKTLALLFRGRFSR
jgi:dolichol-phosphate mannosyltransferase